MNFEHARFNMIEQQIRPWSVLDPRVLELLSEVPREDFVPAPYRNLALADMRIPIGHGQVMMTPKVEARLVQELEISSGDRILEVGTGSGYVTALLAKLGGEVHSVEIFQDLQQQAAARLQGFSDIHLHVGDAAHGWDAHGEFDVILLTGSVPELSERFRHPLRPGGRLGAIVGQAPVMIAQVVSRTGEQGWATRSLFETDLPPLVHAEAQPQFVF